MGAGAGAGLPGEREEVLGVCGGAVGTVSRREGEGEARAGRSQKCFHLLLIDMSPDL